MTRTSWPLSRKRQGPKQSMLTLSTPCLVVPCGCTTRSYRLSQRNFGSGCFVDLVMRLPRSQLQSTLTIYAKYSKVQVATRAFRDPAFLPMRLQPKSSRPTARSLKMALALLQYYHREMRILQAAPSTSHRCGCEERHIVDAEDLQTKGL